MTPEEYDVAYLTILGEWEQPWGKNRQDLARRLWANLDGQAVFAALERFLGQPFAPTPGAVRVKVIELGIEEGDWAEVWDHIMRKVRNFGWQNWEQIEWSPQAGPFMAYIGKDGFKDLCLCDNGDLPTVQAQLREKWKAWRERERVRRTVEDLPATKALGAGRGQLDAIRKPNLTE